MSTHLCIAKPRGSTINTSYMMYAGTDSVSATLLTVVQGIYTSRRMDLFPPKQSSDVHAFNLWMLQLCLFLHH